MPHLATQPGLPKHRPTGFKSRKWLTLLPEVGVEVQVGEGVVVLVGGAVVAVTTVVSVINSVWLLASHGLIWQTLATHPFRQSMLCVEVLGAASSSFFCSASSARLTTTPRQSNHSLPTPRRFSSRTSRGVEWLQVPRYNTTVVCTTTT